MSTRQLAEQVADMVFGEGDYLQVMQAGRKGGGWVKSCLADRIACVLAQRVYLDLNPQLLRYIDALTAIGFFGASREEICERLLCRAIEDLAANPHMPIAALLREAVSQPAQKRKKAPQ